MTALLVNHKAMTLWPAASGTVPAVAPSEQSLLALALAKLPTGKLYPPAVPRKVVVAVE